VSISIQLIEQKSKTEDLNQEFLEKYKVRFR